MPADLVHTDLSHASKFLAVIGGFIVIYGLISFVIKERLYLSEPLLAVAVGVIVGPYVLDWVDPLSWGSQEETNELTYQFTRIIVGIQVLFTGISLPNAYLWREKLSLTILLFGIMTVAWLVTALLIWGLVPDLTYLESLTIAAAVTPTDPVLANSITNGRYAEKHVPANVRNIILAESGANDGLGFPFLYLGIYLLARNGANANTSVGTEIGRWVYAVVIYQVLLSICFGSLLGYVARKSLRWAESRSYIDKANFFAYGLGLAFFTLGTTGLFGSDDILACFIAGNSFTWDDWFRLRTEDNDFQEIIDSVLNLTVFIYIGTIIPWADYSDASLGLTGWRVVVLAITVLLLRRPPWVMTATKLIPALRDFKESAFAGWFGPIGVGAVFYIQVALRELPDDGTRDRVRRLYTPVVLFLVFGSVFAHGITIPISKLGPGVVRRTATLTQNRTITFSRPGSRSTTVNKGAIADASSRNASASGSPALPSSTEAPSFPEKELWNPLFALYDGVKHVVLFWRKDSFWRKDIHLEAEGKKVEKAQISAPNRAETARRSIEETQQGDDAPRKSRVPPPALALPTTQPSEAAVPPAPERENDSASDSSATAADGAPPSPSRPPAAHTRVGTALRRAFDRELQAERTEAQDEADAGWQRSQEREARRRSRLSRLDREQRDKVHFQHPPQVPQ